jgi:hypothetical protein
MITLTIWHNVAHDGEGRPSGMLDGYRPGDPVVRVFAYEADPAGRAPKEIAEEAFAIYAGVDLVRCRVLARGDGGMARCVHWAGAGSAACL